MSDVTEVHEERETLTVDVNIPGHEPRVTTPLFAHTRKLLIEREQGRCWICGRTAEEAGQPLEAHHRGVERSFAEGPIDWEVVKKDFPNHDWASFDESKPYDFVDNMLSQGLILCKLHHTGAGTGIHMIPWPLFVMQRYLKAGYKFNGTEIIEHDQQ